MRAPFRVTLAGETFYMVTNSNDVTEVYKNTSDLSFAVFIEDLMISCGTSKETVRKMSQSPPLYLHGAQDSGLNPSKKSLVTLAVDFHHIQLLPGPKSQSAPLTETFLAQISHSLQWESIVHDAKLVGQRRTSEICRTSLLRFCGKVLIEAGTKVYWGDKLWQMAPDMLGEFYKLDRAVWKLLFRYPEVFSKDATTARDTITDILTGYYRLPKTERDDAAWFTKSLETESRALGLEEREMASAILIIYFV
jgi:hypothetical protein